MNEEVIALYMRARRRIVQMRILLIPIVGFGLGNIIYKERVICYLGSVASGLLAYGYLREVRRDFQRWKEIERK